MWKLQLNEVNNTKKIETAWLMMRTIARDCNNLQTTDALHLRRHAEPKSTSFTWPVWSIRIFSGLISLQHITWTYILRTYIPFNVFWCCWLGGRKGIHPVKNWVVGCWHGNVWVKVQICKCPSWRHCHSLSHATVNPDWFYLSGAGSPGKSRTKSKRAIKQLCACVRACVYSNHTKLDIT